MSDAKIAAFTMMRPTGRIAQNAAIRCFLPGQITKLCGPHIAMPVGITKVSLENGNLVGSKMGWA